MNPTPHFYTYRELQVKADSLTPCQRRTRPSFKTATDFYQVHLLKHTGLSEFHSFAELLNAGLLEGDHHVINYVPQPFMVWVGNRRYTPDSYVARDNGPREVLELKPRGEFPDAKRDALTQYLEPHNMVFDVISNESVYARRLEAENWLEIVRNLYLARDLDTAQAEQQVMEHVLLEGECPFEDFVDMGDRESSYPAEIAVMRLLHRGQLTANLSDQPFNLDTVLSRCP